MLKIKDNVDLKELEKFGFRPRYFEETGKLREYHYDFKGVVYQINIYSGNRHIYTDYARCEEFSDILYDLIKADLVEKVEE